MQTRTLCLFLTTAAVSVGLPSARVQSQLAPAAGDPLAALQTMQTANDDLLKRQEATLKDLTEATDAAREVKIFSRRG